MEIHWESIGNLSHSLPNPLEINELPNQTLEKAIGNRFEIDYIPWPALAKSITFLTKSLRNQMGINWKLIGLFSQSFRSQSNSLPHPEEINSMSYQIV